METLKERLKRLWHDDRSFKKRFFIAFFVNVSLAFFMLFFTPCEMFIGNMGDFGFPFKSMAVVMGIASAAYIVIATLLLLILRGKIFDIATTFIFSFTVASYLQGNFMNGEFGSMDGQPISWQEHAKLAMLNLLIWAIVMLVPYVIRYFSRNVWSKVLQYGSAFLVVIQAVALVTLLVSADFTLEQGNSYLSRDGLYSVGDDNNVIVLVLDYFDNEYADLIEDETPGYFDKLEGFTRFTNMTSVYRNTMPSIPYLLTGYDWNPDENIFHYPQTAFESSDFLRDITELDARVGVYVKSMYVGPGGYEYIDNFRGNTTNLDYFGVFRAMENCTLYRTAPIVAKPSFWFYTEDLAEMATDESAETLEDIPYDYDDAQFYSGLKENGLSVLEDDGRASNFTFIHLNGAHFPYSLDENGEYTEAASDRSQIKGAFHIVYDYLDRLKALGLYDSSTIIITTDHGVGMYDEEEVNAAVEEGYVYFGTEYEVNENFAPTPMLFVKPAGKGEGDPYELSDAPVSQTEFHATIIDALGGDGSKYGRTFFDVPEDEERTRKYYFRNISDGLTYEFEINGWARDVNNWSYTGKKWVNADD